MTRHPSYNDPLECRAFLAESLADPALRCFVLEETSTEGSEVPTDAVGRAAYAVAVSVGRCRLFGVPTEGNLDGALPLPVALAAAQEMNLHVCKELRAAAKALPMRLEAAVAFEAEDSCADLLGGRLNAWAAEVALDEAYRAEVDESVEKAKKLFGALSYLSGEIALVDESMRESATVLTLAASGNLLQNWRSFLSPEYAELAPWWLTGELERLATHLADEGEIPWLAGESWTNGCRAIRSAGVHDGEGGRAADESRAELEPELATAADASAEPPNDEYIEDEEMATAADDGGLAGPIPDKQRTIQYLTSHLREIIRHGNSDVWFAVDSDGEFTAHTYDDSIAAGYPRNTGPLKIPTFVTPSNLIEPDVKRLIRWMIDLNLPYASAQQVCHNLGWRW